MCTPRASASTSSGCAYSRSIRSRTRRSRARSLRRSASEGLGTCQMVARPAGAAQRRCAPTRPFPSQGPGAQATVKGHISDRYRLEGDVVMEMTWLDCMLPRDHRAAARMVSTLCAVGAGVSLVFAPFQPADQQAGTTALVTGGGVIGLVV